MVKIGIIADTHIKNSDKEKKTSLLNEIKEPFKNVDKIIHAGDIINDDFRIELEKIAPVEYVTGEEDNKKNLKEYTVIKVEQYDIGIIHQLPKDLEKFCKLKNLFGGILIFGHTHKPLIKGTSFNTLLLNPGSPTEPKAPDKIKGFKNPVARPSIMILNIDSGIVSTFIINPRLHF